MVSGLTTISPSAHLDQSCGSVTATTDLACSASGAGSCALARIIADASDKFKPEAIAGGEESVSQSHGIENQVEHRQSLRDVRLSWRRVVPC